MIDQQQQTYQAQRPHESQGSQGSNEPPDSRLLDEFLRTRSQDAFAALVRRHVDLVYSAARRQLGGNCAAAEDATQAVFLLLAQKADQLGGTLLCAWLFATTR